MRHICLFIILFSFLNIQCKKDSSSQTLPPITDKGANTFGCKVDGKTFIPNGSAFGPQALSITYNPYQNSLQISATVRTERLINAIDIYIEGIDIKSGTKLNLDRSGTTNAATARYSIVSGNIDEYQIVAAVPGSLEIKRFDPAAHIISGAFNFEAINKDNKKVQVTEGRFDLGFM